MTIENGPAEPEGRSAVLHKKSDLGSKVVMHSREVYLEKTDAELIEEGAKITLMNWANCTISKKETLADGRINLTGTIDEDDKDFKGTIKVTWLCADPATLCEVDCVELGHLITKQKIEEADEIKDIVNNNSRVVTTAYAEGCVRNLQHGTTFQFERNGYYFVDKIPLQDQRMTLIMVPDGKQKNMSVIKTAIDQKETVMGGTGKVDKAGGK